MSLFKSIATLSISLLLLLHCTRKNADVIKTNEIQDSTFTEISLDTLSSIPVEPIPDTTFFYSKSGCYGECPVFSYLVMDNGHSYYKGLQHIERIGHYHLELNEVVLTSLEDLIQGEKLWEMSEMYPEDINMWIMDLPTTTIILKKDGIRKSIANNHSAPEALMRFENSLEAFVERQNLAKVVSPR